MQLSRRRFLKYLGNLPFQLSQAHSFASSGFSSQEEQEEYSIEVVSGENVENGVESVEYVVLDKDHLEGKSYQPVEAIFGNLFYQDPLEVVENFGMNSTGELKEVVSFALENGIAPMPIRIEGQHGNKWYVETEEGDRQYLQYYT